MSAGIFPDLPESPFPEKNIENQAEMPTRLFLVGVDGSAASLTALRWAAHEATRRNAGILAVRSWHGRVTPHGTPLDRERERARRALTADVRAVLGPDPAVHVQQELAYGHPARNLLRLAAKADLLVLGDTAAARGPVRTACLRMSPCPVALVPPLSENPPPTVAPSRERLQRGNFRTGLRQGG